MVWRTKLARGLPARWSEAVLACGLALFAPACGGSDDDDDDDEEERKPDTGYGADQAVPSPRSCEGLCARLGDCAAALCNEDSSSTRYDVLEELLYSQCLAACTDAIVNSSELSDAQWSCMFQSSCRQVFDYDECNADGSYYCR